MSDAVGSRSGTPGTNPDVATDAGSEHEDNATNLIVNYVPPSMTQQEFSDLFAPFGPIKSCKLMIEKWTGKSLGYGFVDFYSPGSAQTAISRLNGYSLQSKVLKVSLARPSSSAITKANLYIKNIPSTMGEHELEGLFAPFGKIINVRILVTQSNESRGVGFVRYDKRTSAERAVAELNNTVPPGATVPLVVRFADDHTKPTMRMGRNRMGMFPDFTGGFPLPVNEMQALGIPYGYMANGMHMYGGAMNGMPFQPMQPMGAMPRHNPRAFIDQQPVLGGGGHMPSGYSLFIYNLPPETDDTLLPRIFSSYGIVVNTRVIRDPAHGRCKGYGFVTMKYYQEAVAAIQGVHGQRLGARTLEVSFKTDSNGAPGAAGGPGMKKKHRMPEGAMGGLHFALAGAPGMMGEDQAMQPQGAMHADPHHPM